MLPSLLLALREGVEAALVVGLLVSALKKMQRTDLAPHVWWGVAAGAVISLLVAVVLNLVGTTLVGAAEKLFEGLTMLAAAVLLTWMIVWMSRQAHLLRRKVEQDVRSALSHGSGWALFFAAFLAVVREGVELAIYLVAAGMASNPLQELVGAVVGLILAAGLGWLLFSSARRLPLQRFFQVTNVLLILFAAGLLAHGIGELNEVGWIPSGVVPLYNLTAWLPQESLPGQLLHTLFGYTDTPSLVQTLAYLVYFAVLGFFTLRTQAKLMGRAQNAA